jgi:rhodanese-related sulfurtransferase
MRRLISNLTLNQKLALAAFVLAAVAVAARPMAGHAVTIDPRELAVIVESEVDHVAAGELAGWIIAGRSDYRLVDLRDEEQYAEYHIPGAELIPLTALPEQAFSPTEKVVLYSEGGIHSAQAWFLLRARGARNAYMLLGGLESWKSDVLFPTLVSSPTTEQQRRNEEMKSVAAHFGGQAMLAAEGGTPVSAAASTPAMPKVAMPTAPAAAGGAPAPAKKKKEGC